MTPKVFNINRRRFLKTTAAITAATGVPGWFVELEQAHAAQPKPLGPNDRPGIALVGCGGQGRGDCSGAAAHGDVLAVCDLDDSHAEAAAKQFTKNGKVPEKYKDFRKLMERDDVHAIITGTPDHWHTFVNLLAVKTGKDVYSEKPLTLTIDEGKRLVKAVRDNKRILQVGSQQRSDRNFRLACELTRNGRIGKLQHIIVGLPTGRWKARSGRTELGLLSWAGADDALQRQELPLGLPLVVCLQRRPDDRLGCSPQRHRPMGQRHRTERSS